MKRWIYIAAIAFAAVSCKLANNIGDTATELFRGEVVAKAGSHKLYRSQLEPYIPHGVSPQDSINLARQYMDAWAEDILMLDMAEEQLSKEEKDVTKELEDYRRTLLKYRYEQRYIDQRLDTLITDEEIGRFYKNHQDLFRLDRPLIKSRYLIIPADSKNLKKLRNLISAEEAADLQEAAMLASTSAIKYADSADTWMDGLTLAQELGMDYRNMLSSIKGQFMEWKDEAGNLHIAYIADMVPEGKTAPEEFCTERIRDLILSERKHTLENTLEQNLLEEARKNKKYVIY